MGGFSIGGGCVIKYAELALRNNSLVKPAALFAIDAPLDFERDYKSMMRETRLPNSSEEGLAESNYILKRLIQEFSGTPYDNLSSYHQISPCSYTDTTQYAINLICPFVYILSRILQWWLNEGVDYSLMNAFDFAAMANALKRMGNTKVQLIITDNKGYRKPGHKRHPHSWSIAEPVDLVTWLLSQN